MSMNYQYTNQKTILNTFKKWFEFRIFCLHIFKYAYNLIYAMNGGDFIY
jgi:hypothetical protein